MASRHERPTSIIAAALALSSAFAGGCIGVSSLSGAPDAGSTSADGGSGPVVDAGPPGKSLDDAGGATGNGDDGGSFCSTYSPSAWSVFVCSDFDETPLPGAWASMAHTAGTLTENNVAAVSPPNSLDEKVQPLVSGDVVDVSLRTPLAFPQLPATMKLAFSLDPITIDPQVNATTVLAAMDFVDGAHDRYSVVLSGIVVGQALTLQLGEQSAAADGGAIGAYATHALPASLTLPVGSFTPIVIEIDWTSFSVAQVIVDVGGKEQLNVPLTVAVMPASMQLGIGTPYVAPFPTAAWELRYDNVVLTAK
jgi:hypothetical protein